MRIIKENKKCCFNKKEFFVEIDLELYREELPISDELPKGFVGKVLVEEIVQ